MSRNEITCIVCPLGCRIELDVGPDRSIQKITGYQCKQGKAYAVTEYENPVRVLTSTVLVEASENRLLPVRTDRPVPKDLIGEIMHSLSSVRVKPPIEVGNIIVQNILATGANLVSTGALNK